MWPNPFYSKGQAGTFSYSKQSILEDTWEMLSSHVHHVGLIRVRYFDNLICGWTGAWVLFLLEQASHL